MSTKAPAESETTCVALFGIDSNGNLVALKIDDTGRLVIGGGAANLGTPAGNPMPIAGFDSGNSGRVQVPDIDSTGAVRLQSGGTKGSTAPTRATQVGGVDAGGLLRALLVSAAGILQTSAAKGTTTSSTGLETNKVISASACLVARISMLNTNAAVRYVHAFNATSLPANGAVPTDTAHATTGQRAILTYAIPTDRFGTGCVVAISTTSNTLTLGAAEALFTVDQFPSNS